MKAVGADIHAKNKYCTTPLHSASYEGHLEVVKYLKSVGADIHAKTNNGYTPLNVASRNGHLEVVKYLKSVGATEWIIYYNSWLNYNWIICEIYIINFFY